MDAEQKLAQIIVVLDQLAEDTSVPRNIRRGAVECKERLQKRDEALDVRTASAIFKLDEMAKVATMKQLEGCIGATPFKWRPLPMAKEFDQMYKKKFGADAISTFEAACNYEVLHAVARAMEKAGTVTDARKIKAALKDVLPVKQAMTMRNGIADDGSLLGPTWGTEVIKGEFAPPFELKWER